ncbi:MAG TPA: DUF2530 domain-containing protein [Actinotalea sp.]|nr:DUF2530 domain-containing protein [Actinotalea sp.]
MPTPSERPSLLAPSTLAPVEVDLGRVFRWGIALWGVALVVTGVLALTGRLDAQPVAVCVAGLAIGVGALVWERGRSRRRPVGPAPSDPASSGPAPDDGASNSPAPSGPAPDDAGGR